ncbi:hypothetical protein TTHERM_001106189 (macronuclear) [Tetrahymena thermophila SB210]|uniref:Uncharacterized protein n=1 Tax=Tetrahymena thermophila (strain SB210) TaxID=312017 RepID=W7X010_TETTS|nr:hypothetical protein TTHERM_001106189 [Tetrahymena thermophila SB210]EWS72440.1 hypothetical protein TTHERM_001106189 [Tetrahymena thermophila SB210]|eukprot:XP_012655027.1 hypothetical protein TTHERM_001106189 [Tetrahymena thermophila SB210]
MNKSSHKPIFEQKKVPQNPPFKPPQKQEQANPAAPSQPQGGGRSININTPEMIKKIELHILGKDSQVGPFSGYNSTVQSNTSLSSSRVYENPKENPLLASFVKELVSYEVNERYKILIERNQKLEEQLKTSHKRLEQLETSFQSQQELQSQGNNTIMDISEIHSVIGNNQQIEELTQNYTNIKQNVENLKKQLDEDIKQQVVTTLDNIQQKDSKMSQILEQMNQKYENKLQLIEQQIKVFSQGNGSNDKVDGVDEMTIKRLEAEQLQVQSELKQLKQLLEAHQQEQIQIINQNFDEKLKNINKEFEKLNKSITDMKQDIDSSIQERSLNTSILKDQTDYQKQIEILQKSIQELSLQKQAPTSELERENKDLKEKFFKYQRETSTQIEELRRLILSNPQMMMEASKGSFRRQATYGEEYGGVYDGSNFQMYQDFKNRQQSSDNDLVEIDTYGSMMNSKVSNQGDFEYKMQNNNKDLEYEMQRSITFGGQNNEDKNKQNQNQDQEWLQKYKQHEENVEELINKFSSNTFEVDENNDKPQQVSGNKTNPNLIPKNTDDISLRTKQLSQEMPERKKQDDIGGDVKASFDDMKINYDGIQSFIDNYQKQDSKLANLPKETESQYEVQQSQNQQDLPHELLQSEVSLTSGTSHEQILNSLGYKEQSEESNDNQVDIKMTQSTVSNNQPQIKISTQSQPINEIIEEEEQGETFVFDTKSKKFNNISPLTSPQKMTASQAMRKSQELKKDQLIEVNVHDLSFKDEDNKQIYESLCGSHKNIPLLDDQEIKETSSQKTNDIGDSQKSLDQRSSSRDLAYSIIVTQPPDQESIKIKQENQQNTQKEEPIQAQENQGQSNLKESQEKQKPQSIVSAPHPAKADDTIDDDEIQGEDDELEQSNKKVNETDSQIQENQEQPDQQFFVENRAEYVLSSNVQQGNEERESLQADTQSQDQGPQVQYEEEEEVVYQLDENGFLMDEKGNYILGDDGEMVKLGDDDIQYLRQTNMLEEF